MPNTAAASANLNPGCRATADSLLPGRPSLHKFSIVTAMLKVAAQVPCELDLADNESFQVPPGEDSVTANAEQRIWFHPPKFWAATNHMRKEEADELLNRVIRMAENSELDRLRQYTFISVGVPKDSREQ